MQILRCVQRSLEAWKVAVITILVGVVGALLILMGYFFCCQRASKPVRAFQAVRKRAQGMPKPGRRMSVVVTDIEGYSGGCLEGCRGALAGMLLFPAPAVSLKLQAGPLFHPG